MIDITTGRVRAEVDSLDDVATYVEVETPASSAPSDAVAWISSHSSGWYDRAGVVEIITALTDLIEAADAKDAAKLKRGDRLKIFTEFIVITDETDDGLVDVISLESGVIEHGRRAVDLRQYRI